MHASLVRSAKGAAPLHAVKAANLKRWLPTPPQARGGMAARGKLSARSNTSCCWSRRRGGLAVPVLGLGKGDDPLAAARVLRKRCRPAPMRSATCPEDIGGATRRSHGCSAPIASPATARRATQNRPEACVARRRRRRGGHAHRRRRVPGAATSSTRRPTTWARRNLPPPRAISPNATARSSRSIVGRRSAQEELSADPCRGPRLGASAAADRFHLGRTRPRPRSPWWARACASIPAGSTSRTPPACSR